MKIFLTGASGFIGKKFAEFAANDGKFIYAQMRKKKNIFSLQRNIKCLIISLLKNYLVLRTVYIIFMKVFKILYFLFKDEPA